MPSIFDNISEHLAPSLITALEQAYRADFCVGYFNLRGWKLLADKIDHWEGAEDSRVRLLVGMQTLPQKELRDFYRQLPDDLDNATARRLLRDMAKHFKEQLTYGVPTNDDERALKQLSQQLKTGKVVVKLSVRKGLHAKLYLLHRHDQFTPIIPYLGSSNLTVAGLSYQGELNVDVLERDSAKKLSDWFEHRWEDRWSIDISKELIEIIDSSWAGEKVTPYQIYIKMAYELSREARAGLTEFNVPKTLRKQLFSYQSAAVSIAAHHLNKRGGVVLGDVVGLGKTLMATTLAKIFEDDHGTETLILCPKNLEKMWRDYVERYGMRARVIPTSKILQELPELRRYRVIVIDESHNFRNREGRKYRVLQEYIDKNDSKCILLSATPYNKTYLDLSNQLALFLGEDTDLGIRPEALIRNLGELQFLRLQAAPRTLKAFEHSFYADDWRDLMRLFMVRRTRSFIQNNYAQKDDTGRAYLTYPDGTRSYFPTRVPKTVRFAIDDNNPKDPYARLYANDVVQTIEDLILPRYGLGNYIAAQMTPVPTVSEQQQIKNLGRAGQRLIGFCRTNLFKRLESGGTTFIQSLERHVLRNYIFIYALENELPLPIGTQTADLLNATFDEDLDDERQTLLENELTDNQDDLEELEQDSTDQAKPSQTESEMKARAKAIYELYQGRYKKRFKWLRSQLFTDDLKTHLEEDATAIQAVLKNCGSWNPDLDTKLGELYKLIATTHPEEKILVFTQFADTVHYLERELKFRGIGELAGVVGSSHDPTELAWRFSPHSNDKKVGSELRVLISTDVLSEGQNLQDAHIVVNFDLPWAIIRLIQRAGRVDRIGQQAEEILCYSFLPAEGVERIIGLRNRVKNRLQQNAEVVGTDERFFEDDHEQVVLDLYNEKSGLLDGENDTEVDLASYAYQIWKNAISHNPSLEKTIIEMPNVVYSAKTITNPTRSAQSPNRGAQSPTRGALMYARTAQGNDALVWIDENGQSVSQSQLEILETAACTPNTISQPRAANHHELVERGIDLITEDEKTVGGQLGKPSGARFRTYERLKAHAERIKNSLFDNQALHAAIDEIYRYPLFETARDSLNRQLKAGISDEDLCNLVFALREDHRLCNIQEDTEGKAPEIICSLGLV
ncbi:MAG: hypothetical protein RLZZ156_54 [Deinococcota bacterium]|jgi:superfamily II DNA or RNA helicase/HKD family nuclease